MYGPKTGQVAKKKKQKVKTSHTDLDEVSA